MFIYVVATQLGLLELSSKQVNLSRVKLFQVFRKYTLGLPKITKVLEYDFGWVTY